jgi:beta-lactamase superfamily II metal-dependent hydrolase
MIDYGAAPAQDELEVSVFGPGYGEAIAIHLGQNNWILIDSCMDPESKLPATLNYLQKIGVSPSVVQAIVASHWHDDHVRGISKLAEVCNNAEFFFSGVFNKPELLAFLLAHSPETGAIQSGGTKELVKVIKSKKAKMIFTNQRTLILQETLAGRNVQVSAFSPTQNAQTHMLNGLASYLPTDSEPINHAPDLKPNLSSVVVHVDFGDDAILLGSDLEEHTNLGWRGIIEHAWCIAKTKATAFKVAHHGSITGHNEDIWSVLLNKPISVLTPFIRGNVELPTASDRSRIKSTSTASYISSGASKKPEMDHQVVKRLNTITTKLAKVNPGFGGVRLRKKTGAVDWKVELFGKAEQL